MGGNSASQDRVTEKTVAADKLKKEVDDAVVAVKNRILDGILTAMDNVKIPRVELLVRPFTYSSGHGPSSMFQNLDHMDFSKNIKNTPLISVSYPVDLNIEHK